MLPKSIPDISIHLAGGFNPVGYLLAATRAIYREHPCTRGCQTGHRNKTWGKQTEEKWTVKESSVVSYKAIDWW